MHGYTVLCIVALAGLLGAVVAEEQSAFDLGLDPALVIMPGMFISSSGPHIDFVTTASDQYSLQRHAVKDCKPCPGVRLDVCKQKMLHDSGSPPSTSQWSHLFQTVAPEQHLALELSGESFSCEKYWPLRFVVEEALHEVELEETSHNVSACAIHPVVKRTCRECLNSLSGKQQNPCRKCMHLGFDCSCVSTCRAIVASHKPLVTLENGCFGFHSALAFGNRSTALYTYNFGNFRHEMTNIAVVDPAILRQYDMFFFTDSHTISSIMKLVAQGWAVCSVKPSSPKSTEGFILPGFNAHLNYRLVSKWFKFGHVPTVLQSYQYLIHADSSTFAKNHNYYHVPLPEELNSLVTLHPSVALFWSSHPLRTKAVQEIFATVEGGLEPPDGAARWLASLRKDPFYFGTLDEVPVFQTGVFIRKLQGENAAELGEAFKQLFWTMNQYGLYRDQNVLPFILFKHMHANVASATICAFNVGKNATTDKGCSHVHWPQTPSFLLTQGLETPRTCTNPGWQSQPSFVSYYGDGGMPLSQTTADETSRVAHLGCNFRNATNPASVYMWNFVERLQTLKQYECSDLVVYGAAFGPTYLNMLKVSKTSPNRSKSKALLRAHGSCFFTFVQAEDNAPTTAHSNILQNLVRAEDGLSLLLPVDTAALNLVNKRRSTKLFKFFGHKIFPWAKRILWQDAKLGIGRRFPINIDLTTFFEKTVKRNKVCVSFMGLPVNEATMGPHTRHLRHADFSSHCSAIVKSSRKDVTDDRKGLLRQCLFALERVLAEGGDVSLDLSRNLVDTALIAWDFSAERCRAFAEKLYCSWAHEVNCFSDRDQVSFPYALHQTGLQRKAAAGAPGNSPNVADKHVILVDANRKPTVQIVDASCHWYSDYSIEKCLDGVVAPGNKRVAVLVAGSYNRYFFKSSAEQLVKPLTKQGYHVDYFLSLTTEAALAYRSELGYTNRATFDPEFATGGRGKAHQPTYISLIVRKVLGEAGARLLEFSLQHQLSLSSDARLRKIHRSAKRENPTEDVDLRFPTKDPSPKADHSANAVANRNLLRLHLAMERLWWALIRAETEDSEQYEYVLFLRDDVKWLANFNMDKLIAQGPADVYLLSCDAREPPLHPDEINDHGLVAKRKIADVFGFYLSRLLQANVDDCRKRMIQPMGERGCNSEMLLKWVIEKESLNVKKVGQSLLPFQRSMHLDLNGTVVECFHKYCKSVENNLEDFGMQRCKTIKLPTGSASGGGVPSRYVGHSAMEKRLAQLKIQHTKGNAFIQDKTKRKMRFGNGPGSAF